MVQSRSEMPIEYNVGIRIVDTKTGKMREMFGNNQVCRNLLIGIMRFVKGDFTAFDPNTRKYIPATLHVGDGDAVISIDDHDLDSPIYVYTYVPLYEEPADWSTHYSDYYTYNSTTEVYSPCTAITVFDPGNIYKRENPVLFSTNANSDIESNSAGTDYVEMQYRFFIDTNQLVGEHISEIGLFTDNSSGSYFLDARYLLETPIDKTNTEFIDIIWQLTFRSYHPEPEE